jgi:hypothetical protein
VAAVSIAWPSGPESSASISAEAGEAGAMRPTMASAEAWLLAGVSVSLSAAEKGRSEGDAITRSNRYA